MNTRSVNSAAGVVLAAMQQNRTPAGIAMALESAGLLMSPEAAEDLASVSADAVAVAEKAVTELRREHEESARLRARVAELEPLAEQLDFLDRTTLPDLRRQIEHHEDGKARWRKRAEDAEARVAKLEAERHTTNAALSDAAEALREQRDRMAELEALKPATIQTCRQCGAGYTYGEPCSTCLFKARMAVEQSADRLTRMLAPTQALQPEPGSAP